MDWQKASAELAKKLDPAHVRPARSFGPKGDYIEGWHAINEANRIFGFDGWSYSLTEAPRCVSERPRQIGKPPNTKDGWAVSYLVRLSVAVGGVTREDCGVGHGYDIDCGLAHESAVKEAVTDALKRTLRTFGNPFGLALYDKERSNVGVDFDWPAEADRIIAALSSAPVMAELQARWKANAEAIAQIKAASPPDYARIEAAKEQRKALLQQEKDAA